MRSIFIVGSYTIEVGDINAGAMQHKGDVVTAAKSAATVLKMIPQLWSEICIKQLPIRLERWIGRPPVLCLLI